ncbi:hypothetical protein MRX96_016265 [Rhipicephalus microplus]
MGHKSLDETQLLRPRKRGAGSDFLSPSSCGGARLDLRGAIVRDGSQGASSADVGEEQEVLSRVPRTDFRLVATPVSGSLGGGDKRRPTGLLTAPERGIIDCASPRQEASGATSAHS